MATSESLYNSTQNFFSPDFIQKFSAEIQQPIEKTKATLKAIIPTVLMGIVNKGSTPEGAETLVNLASKQGPPPTAENINTVPNTEVVNGIFGNNVNSVVSKLGVTTGMNPSSITKILGMVTPMIMGVLGSKIKNEKLNANGLMNFLEQQKSSLAGIIPGGISKGFAGATSNINPSANLGSATGVIHDQFTKKSSWGKIGLLALAALALIWLFNARKSAVRVVPPPTVVTQNAAPVMAAQSLTGLESFMSSTSGDIVKRFGFDHLNFASGTTALVTGSEAELNQIAESMKKFPAVSVIVEGFTDNVGVPASNLTLSTNRATEVKNQLVQRGIDPNRIEVKGFGEASPIGSNISEAGRALNRRIELVVKRQ